MGIGFFTVAHGTFIRTVGDIMDGQTGRERISSTAHNSMMNCSGCLLEK